MTYRILNIRHNRHTITLQIVLLLLILLSLDGTMSARPVYSQQPALPFVSTWLSNDTVATTSLAWGDYDHDGDLDLAAGAYALETGLSGQIGVYQNEADGLASDQVSIRGFAGAVSASRSVVWGDYDGDGDLDLLAGGNGLTLYRNDNGRLRVFQTVTSGDSITSIALGDYDGDGDLDIAIGTAGQPNWLLRNESGVLNTSKAWSSIESDMTYSVAWGDYDGDGDLDLAAGNAGQPNRIYQNTNGTLHTTAIWSSTESDTTQSIAWGDVDNDGDLDLVAGNIDQPNRLYHNNNGTLDPTAIWSSDESDTTESVAWGDADNDGDLDLAVGNNGQATRLYLNDAGSLTSGAVWSSSQVNLATSVAWGDVDHDGDLDLAVGNYAQPDRLYRNENIPLNGSDTFGSASLSARNLAWGDMDSDGDLDLAIASYGQPTRLYLNTNGQLAANAVWESPIADNTLQVAWGDVDGDGDLDLALSNDQQPDRIYPNNDGVLSQTSVWSSSEKDASYDLAWGDVDGDDDLDLVVAGLFQSPKLYLNNQGDLDTVSAWSPIVVQSSASVSWGDLDNDGDLDLAVGNTLDQPNYVYRNDNGSLTRQAIWTSLETDSTNRVAWGDVDGDGDLDLVAGNLDQSTRLYRNDNGVLTRSAVWNSDEADATTDLAWGDIDNDGDLDLAVANADQPDRIYRNDNGVLTTSAAWSSPESNATQALAWGDIDNDGDLDLAVANEGQPNRVYRNVRDTQPSPAPIPIVALDQPGDLPAATGYAVAQRLTGPTIDIPYRLIHRDSLPVQQIIGQYSLDGGGHWHPALAATGTVTTSLATSPAGTPHTFTWDVPASGIIGQSDNVVFRLTAIPATRTPPGQIPRPLLYGQYAATTYPFRLRGSQVQVVGPQQPATDALVYRRPDSSVGRATAYANLAGTPFRTDEQGFLQGRGQINIGDTLVALAPISATDTYTLYHTSARPTVEGLEMVNVSAPGVQTLTVSPDYPLILFNFDVSLEWDARNDPQFLTRLREDLRRTSELLFDWTDGQAALGDITVYHHRQQWNDAHIRIYASNRLRPNANQGGIIDSAFPDPDYPDIMYEPGQVRMGVIWNRYGEASDNLGEDWPRTLAHELGHFALFLDDNYLGLDGSGRLVPVEGCPGAMSDPYREDYSEFHPAASWNERCQETLSQQNTGRSDWTTIKTFYDHDDMNFGLNQPDAFNANPGPGALPLEVTHVTFREPAAPIETLDVPIFTLTQGGAQTQLSSNARTFLFRREHDYLLDLGRPTRSQVTAHGARPGDRLCVYDSALHRLGCEEPIQAGDEHLELITVTNWQPDILVTPVTSRTIDLQVMGVPDGTPMYARLFPTTGTASQPIQLNATDQGYAGTFTSTEPVLDGYVQVWVDEPAPRREMVVDYALGGNPGRQRSRNTPRGSPGRQRSRNAPAVSPDGQVILFGDNLAFNAGEFFTIQAASAIPAVPPSRTIIGQGYWLRASANAPDLQQASLNIGYLGQEVVPGEETGITMYFWDGTSWTMLDTTLNTNRNEASARVAGPGLYVLMSSIEIRLDSPGWNVMAYAAPEDRPVAEALASIDGFYTTVYKYQGNDRDDPWKVYDIAVPDWVNDLGMLESGQGYWINATEAVTLYLSGQSTSSASLMQSLPIPPATFYGQLEPWLHGTPRVGMTIEARINGVVCGQTQTRAVDDQIVFVIDVVAAGSGSTEGCGVPGRHMTFWLDDQVLPIQATWNNARPRDIASLRVERLFLPFIAR